MKKINKYRKAFTIIEVIIATALLGAVSVYVFAIAEPLRIKTEQVQSRLIQYAEMQYLTLFLTQLVSVFDIPEMLSKQGLESFINSRILFSSNFMNLDTVADSQMYALFSKSSTKVLCGFFNPLNSDIKSNTLLYRTYGTLKFQCHFIYQNRRHTYTFLDSHALSASSTSVATQIQGTYTQIIININEYNLTAGFLPSVKQVVQ
jgi:prepilin-type N-terminal cleavage/methylation domain-containing protein